VVESLTLTTSDDVSLEAEIEVPEGAGVGVVLCHPHPQYGGSMRSIVIGALFDAFRADGVACIRFNFRGVEGSGGEYTGGDRERLDATAGFEALRERIGADAPVVMAGWSFGGDVALAVTGVDHVGWIAVAPPLRFLPDAHAETAADPRPKAFLLGQHDQFRPPAEVEAQVATWTGASVEIVGGADHYFIGRTDRLAALARDALASLTGAT